MAALSSIALSCHTHTHDEAGGHTHGEDGHTHGEHGHTHSAVGQETEPLVYTYYSDKTELFIEFNPLVQGEEVAFAAHFTALGETFKAIAEGKVTLTLANAQGVRQQSVTADKAEPAGIFRLRLTPAQPGTFSLVFDIVTPTYTDRITIAPVEVYPDMAAARQRQQATDDGGGDIRYTKEQAWKVDFASAPAKVQPFGEYVRTSGQLIAAPGDEAVVTAQTSGFVSLAGKSMAAGSLVAAGSPLFKVKSNELVLSSLAAAVGQAEQELATARAQYERAAVLSKDNITTDKELLEAKLRLDNARTQLAHATASQNFNRTGELVTAPVSGYVKNVFVESGAYVQAGQPLASLSQNKQLLLRADLSQQYFHKLATFTAANFSMAGGQIFSTEALNGRVVSIGKSAEGGAPFLPVYFSLNNHGSLLPGAVVEVFLRSASTPALVIPVSALMEEQGSHYVYVQTSGETFQKRELRLGASDGLHVQVLSGLQEGERVVTRGAYQIKLSVASATMPAHGHEH